MWNVTITGHDPENPGRTLDFRVRGAEVRTLSTRVRAATGWLRTSLNVVSGDLVEIRPSLKSQKLGIARCHRIGADGAPLPPGERVHAELRAYSLRDLIDHCRLRRAELTKEKDDTTT